MNTIWQWFYNTLFAPEKPVLAAYHLEVGVLTDKGKQRVNNQDCLGHLLAPDKGAVLAIVADGMGGHQGGEVASQMAVKRVLNYYDGLVHSKINANGLKHSFATANAAIYVRAQNAAELRGMGTTLVALAITQGMAYFAYVGDSRLYRIRAGQCLQLSKDHTLVAEMLKDGLISAENAANHPDKNVITRAIGTHPDVEVDSPERPLPIKIGDSFLLCSDGLHDLVTPGEIIQILADHSSQQACERLIQLANSKGGHDNISALVVNVLEKSTSENKSPETR